jgi:serine/threonine-protein kinase
VQIVEKAPLIANRFQVRAQLGIGTMGWLYRAFDPEGNREVALRIATGVRSLVDARDRLVRHADRLASVAGAVIAPVYACGVADGQLWYSSVLVNGNTLDQILIDGGALAPADAARLMGIVGGALVEPHAHGLLHLDVKLRNVFVDGERVTLVEHGVANAILTDESRLTVNTPASAAPEQLLAGTLDHRTDIYALGACLFHLVVGEPAFKGGSGSQVFGAQLGWRAPRPSDLRSSVPDGLEQIILKAMARRPEDRFQRVAEFSDALSDWRRRDGL